jgi:peroxiredoxin
MPQVQIDKPSPQFTLKNFDGEPVSLSDYRSRKNVVLVFNRGFT